MSQNLLYWYPSGCCSRYSSQRSISVTPFFRSSRWNSSQVGNGRDRGGGKDETGGDKRPDNPGHLHSSGIPSPFGVDRKGRRIPWVDYPASLQTPAGWDRTESAPTRFGKVSRINSDRWPPSARNSVRNRVRMVSRFASERGPRWVGIRRRALEHRPRG